MTSCDVLCLKITKQTACINLTTRAFAWVDLKVAFCCCTGLNTAFNGLTKTEWRKMMSMVSVLSRLGLAERLGLPVFFIIFYFLQKRETIRRHRDGADNFEQITQQGQEFHLGPVQARFGVIFFMSARTPLKNCFSLPQPQVVCPEDQSRSRQRMFLITLITRPDAGVCRSIRLPQILCPISVDASIPMDNYIPSAVCGQDARVLFAGLQNCSAKPEPKKKNLNPAPSKTSTGRSRSPEFGPGFANTNFSPQTVESCPSTTHYPFLWTL